MFPALVGRILFSLFRRRIWVYPSLEDLHNHRKEIEEADKFGAKMTAKMTTSSVITEMWRIFRLADQTLNFTKRKHVKGKEKFSVDPSEPQSTAQEDNPVIDSIESSREERDVKRYGLFLLAEIVDLHERIRK